MKSLISSIILFICTIVDENTILKTNKVDELVVRKTKITKNGMFKFIRTMHVENTDNTVNLKTIKYEKLFYK
jgi:hypothetical protein